MSQVSALNQLKVASLNCWGVPATARHRKERMKALAAALQVASFDVVALQEVWVSSDRTFLITAAATGGLVHAHHFGSGVSGSGLIVLSRYPIVEHQFLRYSINGKPYKIHQADWFGGKGVGLVRVCPSVGHEVDVYVTHLTARYAKDDEYAATRAAQAFECARFVLQTQRSPLALLLGDFNAEPDSLEHRIIVQLSEMHDLWLVCGPSETAGTESPVSGATYCNSYCARDDMAYNLRIDYCFVRLMPHTHPAVQLARVRSTQHPLSSQQQAADATDVSATFHPRTGSGASAGSAHTVTSGCSQLSLLCPLRVTLALDNVPQEGAGSFRGVPHYSDHTGLMAEFSTEVAAPTALLLPPPCTAPAPRLAVALAAQAQAAPAPAPPPPPPGYPHRHAALLSELARVLDAGAREAALRRRWHYRQAAGGVALWLLLVTLAFVFGSGAHSSGSGAIWGSFLAPLAIVYSVSHVFLAELFVRQEAAALGEIGEQVSTLAQHGFRL